jgi:sulfite exporter TauE/SafE
MNSLTDILSGYLAGLSVGTVCIGICLPIFLPVLLSQKRTTRASFLLVVEFSIGRLIGYLFFGLLFGYVGEHIESNYIHYIAALANIWLGISMILYSLGTIDKKFCAAIPFAKIKWVFLLGFLTGVNICPPFLASLVYVFNLKDAVRSLLYFFMFFLGTSTYIIPSAIVGYTTKLDLVQKIARIAGVITGLYFVIQSVINVLAT